MCNKISCSIFVKGQTMPPQRSVLWPGVKRNLVAKPLRFWGGGGQAPREPNTAQNHDFLDGFLVLHKSSKGASTQHLKRPSCELFGALGHQNMHFTCIFTVASLQEEQLACLQVLRALRGQPSKPKNARIL